MHIHLFSECVINAWNYLPASVDCKSLSSFKRILKLVALSKFLKCFNTFFYVSEPCKMFDAFVCFICCMCV